MPHDGLNSLWVVAGHRQPCPASVSQGVEVRSLAVVVPVAEKIALFPRHPVVSIDRSRQPCPPGVCQVLTEHPGNVVLRRHREHRGRWGFGCDMGLQFGRQVGLDVLPGVFPVFRAADVKSDLKRRSEGVRIKHWGGKNSVKMYNKCPMGPQTASPGGRPSHPEARVVACSRPDQEDPAHAPLSSDGIRREGHLCDLRRAPSLPVAVGRGLKCAQNNNASAVNGVSRATHGWGTPAGAQSPGANSD